MKNLSNTGELLKWLNEILAIYVSSEVNVDYKNGDDFYTILHDKSETKLRCKILEPLWCVGETNRSCVDVEWNKDIYKAPLLEKSPLKLIEGEFFNYDVLGLSYWMLTRAEEVDRRDVDDFGRFVSKTSHAYKYNYLDKPVVDEWFQIVREYFVDKCPDVMLSHYDFQMFLSHDVDQPTYYYFRSPLRIVYTMVKDFLRDRDFKKLISFPFKNWRKIDVLLKGDPYNTFEWLMDISEKNKVKSCFYFQCGLGNHFRDAHYSLSHPSIQNLMKNIHDRGHEIGCHPSYMTFLKPQKMKKEVSFFKQALKKLKIPYDILGVRMHFLRWRHMDTLRSLNDVGFAYDTTLGYADRAGFRCGTCREYPAYDPVFQLRLNIKIRPLIVMEQTLLSSKYMNLNEVDEVVSKALEYKKTCKEMAGNFTLLWHNSTLTTDREKKMYQSIVEG